MIDTISIVRETDRWLVVDKPGGIPTVPLDAQHRDEPTLLSQLARDYPEVALPMGRKACEGGVLHRLDTATCGLVLVARDRQAFAFLDKAQCENRFIKTYTAGSSGCTVLKGFPPFPGCYDLADGSPREITSGFRSYGPGRKAVRPLTACSSDVSMAKGGQQEYKTMVRLMGSGYLGEKLFVCRLCKGFRHQVRCHLAWAGYPLVGDALYGGQVSDTGLHLVSVTLEFPDPTTGLIQSISLGELPGWAVSR